MSVWVHKEIQQNQFKIASSLMRVHETSAAAAATATIVSYVTGIVWMWVTHKLPSISIQLWLYLRMVLFIYSNFGAQKNYIFFIIRMKQRQSHPIVPFAFSVIVHFFFTFSRQILYSSLTQSQRIAIPQPHSSSATYTAQTTMVCSDLCFPDSIGEE